MVCEQQGKRNTENIYRIFIEPNVLQFLKKIYSLLITIIFPCCMIKFCRALLVLLTKMMKTFISSKLQQIKNQTKNCYDGSSSYQSNALSYTQVYMRKLNQKCKFQQNNVRVHILMICK